MINNKPFVKRPPKPFATFTLIKDIIDNEKFVSIYCLEGVVFENVIIKSFDTYEITLVTKDGNLVSLYKQAIVYIDYGKEVDE